jgi:hypothetical protein
MFAESRQLSILHLAAKWNVLLDLATPSATVINVERHVLERWGYMSTSGDGIKEVAAFALNLHKMLPVPLAVHWIGYSSHGDVVFVRSYDHRY